MTDLTTAWSAVPRSLRQRSGERDLIPIAARLMSWFWVQWRRREIIQALNKVDDHLLLDVGIERGDIEELVDTLLARRR